MGEIVLTVHSLRVSQMTGNARRIADYLLDRESAPQAFVLDEDGSGDEVSGYRALANSVWLGSKPTLKGLGLERGAEVTRDDLVAALEGRHAQTGAQLRQGRVTADKGRVLANIDLTFAPPKSVSVVWSQAGVAQRAQLERAMMVATNRALEYLTQTKPVVRKRGPDGKRVSEPASGVGASASLHATARPTKDDGYAAPHLHVHCVLVAVQDSSGAILSPDSWPLFLRDAPLEGGAVFRSVLADELIRLGYKIESHTGKKGRFFELAHVPASMRAAMSGRTREVVERQEDLQAKWGAPVTGGGVAVLALETRQTKVGASAEETVRWWRVLGKEHECAREEAEAMLGPRGIAMARTKSATRGRLEALEAIEVAMREQGPTVSRGTARAIAYAAAPGCMSFEDMHAQIDELERDGEWQALRGPTAPRVTTRGIRRLEQRVLKVALDAARREDPPLSEAARTRGIEAANARLRGGELEEEQLDAVMRLTGGQGWAVLTGAAGAGKDPTLHAVAEAYWAEGWQVIDCALDGTTTKRLGNRLGVRSFTVEQLKAQLRLGGLTVDNRTLILVDEATKLGTEKEWEVIARLVAKQEARVLAVGDTQQLDGIELAGMFGEMVRHHEVIPVAVLEEIRRHRHPLHPDRPHPWLKDYQLALRANDGKEAVRILREEGAIKVYDTRQQAMEGMVAEWDGWRHIYSDSNALLVHGSNADVDKVNVLAQRRRRAGRGPDEDSVKAVDRDYCIYAGDTVILRGGAYYLERSPGGRAMERRIENGQLGVVESVDSTHDVVEVSVVEPEGERHVVTFDVARMRRDYAQEFSRPAVRKGRAEPRAPVLRLRPATHPFPEMGATEDWSSSLWHPTVGNEAMYTADTRSRYYHSLHVAREDLRSLIEDPERSANATDEDLFKVLAKKISEPQKRAAAISYPLNPGARINVDLPTTQSAPEMPLHHVAFVPPEPAPERDPTSPSAYRTLLQVDDPLDGLRASLGGQRAAELDKRARALADQVAAWDEPRLLAERDASAEAFEHLDRRGASEALNLELQQNEVGDRSQEALQRATELDHQANQLKGLRRRHERTDLRQEAQTQRDLAERDHSTLASLGAKLQQLCNDGRHPSPWLEQYADKVALWVATERELAIGQALKSLDQPDINQIAERGPKPPERGPTEGDRGVDLDGPDVGH